MSNITIGTTAPSTPEDFNDVLDPAPAVLARSKSHVTLKSEAVTCQMP